MSLHARKPDPIPEETARVARAAFPDGTLYLRMREALDVIYSDEDFADLFPSRWRTASARSSRRRCHRPSAPRTNGTWHGYVPRLTKPRSPPPGPRVER